MTEIVFPLSDLNAKDASLSGSKGASLARMTQTGTPVPPGFIVSTRIFQSGEDGIAEALVGLKNHLASNSGKLKEACEQVQKAILGTPLSDHAVARITDAYDSMGNPPVSVRSSSTAEDLSNVSFAGQYDTFLNICSFWERKNIQMWKTTRCTFPIMGGIRMPIRRKTIPIISLR